MDGRMDGVAFPLLSPQGCGLLILQIIKETSSSVTRSITFDLSGLVLNFCVCELKGVDIYN